MINDVIWIHAHFLLHGSVLTSFPVCTFSPHPATTDKPRVWVQVDPDTLSVMLHPHRAAGSVQWGSPCSLVTVATVTRNTHTHTHTAEGHMGAVLF